MISKRKPKSGVKQAQPGAGNGGIIPPVEHRFKAGAPSPNPHGRPRKLVDLQELIKDVMAENLTPDITRIKAAIRLGLNKNPIIWLEYAFGKVPQPTHEMNNDEWRDWLKENGYSDSDIDSLVNEFAAAMGRRRSGEGSAKTGSANGDPANLDAPTRPADERLQ